ncbi:hypothetical protein ADICYQ_1233 [Cyclobacterium qasimii M12-11B]|nr:hypothetical protein ADICYQ_1233 [Cyclobacterium qasimii M12-11B]
MIRFGLSLAMRNEQFQEPTELKSTIKKIKEVVNYFENKN